MRILVEFRYDRWEVVRSYGYRESLIGFRAPSTHRRSRETGRLALAGRVTRK
jgi:hypothetical protein